MAMPPMLRPTQRRLLWTTAVAVLAAAALWLYGVNRRPSVDAVPAPAGAAQRFNVLLVTLDTTRPDHLGCYGYAPARTPTLDGLAARGVLFENAVSCATSTLPAHSTIHTGLNPLHHGAHENGRSRLADEHTTLAERLSHAGYATAAFVSCFVLDARFGLDQGFSTYDFKVGSGLRGEAATLVHERRADDTTRSAAAWLEQHNRTNRDQPFFLWVHYFDAHYTYDSPLAALPEYDGRPYDAEIAYVDLALGRLLDAVRRDADFDRTLIIVASDHGEGLDDHGESYHGIFVYESTLRAVLVFSCPTLFDRPQRVADRLVGTVDIVPTVLALLGEPPADALDGVNLLAPPADDDRAIYIETYFSRTVGCSELLGLRRRTDKYIRAPRPEYYDLARDPTEQTNLIDERSATALELSSRLTALLAAGNATAALHELTPAEQDRLAGLGYVAALGRPDAAWPDPKDKIDLINSASDVAHLVGQQRFREALPLAQQLVDECGAYDVPIRQLVDILQALHRTTEAADALRRYVAAYPAVDMLIYAAERFRAWEMPDDAASALAAAELLDPRCGMVWKLRGDAAFETSRYAEAARHYTRALDLDAERLGPDVRLRLREAAEKSAGASPDPAQP